MSDFHPTTLYFILFESIGVWLWLLIALALVLFRGVISGIRKLQDARRPARRPLMMATGLGTMAMIVTALMLPGWTQAEVSALAGPIDHFSVLMLALIPGILVAALAFSLAARHCASRQHRA